METKKNNTNYGECRCCLAKGNHKDLMKEYYSNGIREVYFDLFMECFNLFLSTNTNLSTLICTSCIGRLRDASSFKMMVKSTERHLLDALSEDKQTVFVNVPVEESPNGLDLKSEEHVTIKVEMCDSDNVYESDCVVAEECFDFSFKTNTSADLVQGEAELLARFPLRSLKPLPTRRMLHKICPGYVEHLRLLRGIVIPPSMVNLLQERHYKKSLISSRKIYITEKMAHIVNATTLLENSNLTPFRSKNRVGYACFFCRNIFESFGKLRDHTSEHKKPETAKILRRYGPECLVVYVDITDLKCSICNINITNITELKSHLTSVHKKKMYPDASDRVIPFKLSDDLFECQLCGFAFQTFGSIERHMNVHFRNYVCKECGTGFVTKYRLKVHIKSMHVGGTYPCEACGKIFSTQQKHKNHVNTVHNLVKRFKCAKCSERFSEYFRRQKHMVEVHGVAPLKYKCNVCEKTFDRRYTLSRHMKRDHLEERDFQCELCAYKCFTNNELRVHMVKHNGERIYECSVCKKSYARKKTLKEHMRIHNNDRRFACAVCGQAFVQKCSLKGHLKTHHLEYSLQ